MFYPSRKIDLDEKVKDWIKQEGYPLEFSTAYKFKQNGFSVDQSYFVNDSDGKAREVDVLATQNISVGNSVLRLLHVVECKWSKDKPWVLFGDEKRYAPTALAAQLISTSIGQALCWAAAGNDELKSLKVFKGSEFTFSGRQAFSKGNDLFYSSVQSVVSNCVNIVNSYNEYDFRIDRPSVAVIAIPVIVVEGYLYEVKFNNETKDLDLTKTQHSRLRWKGNERRSLNTVVDIVSEDYLDAFLEQRNKEMSVLAQSWSKTFEQLIKCFNEKTEQYLDIKEGPRGIHGRPHVLSQLREISTSNKQLHTDASDNAPVS